MHNRSTWQQHFCVCRFVLWRLCAGYLRVCRVTQISVREPAYSCHLKLRRGNWKWLHFKSERCHHVQSNPKSPRNRQRFPYESLDSKKFHDAANRALDHYLNPSALKSPAARKPSTMYMVAPDIKDEDLLAHTCESLAQASVMASDFAGYLEGPHRHTAMAIQQIVMLAELAVNRMLDNVGVPKPAPHS
ncbi:hypothetical protein ABIA58_000931 [Pseudomonas frederiksbergensis]